MVRTKSPRPFLSSLEEVRRFINCLKQISLKREKDRHEEVLITPQKKHWQLRKSTM
jgi:hypothetical protein